MTSSPYTVETGQSDDGTRWCRLVGPGGELRWVSIDHHDSLVEYADRCNRAVGAGETPPVPEVRT